MLSRHIKAVSAKSLQHQQDPLFTPSCSFILLLEVVTVTPPVSLSLKKADWLRNPLRCWHHPGLHVSQMDDGSLRDVTEEACDLHGLICVKGKWAMAASCRTCKIRRRRPARPRRLSVNYRPFAPPLCQPCDTHSITAGRDVLVIPRRGPDG